MKKPLKGQIAVVTGATQGIGEAVTAAMVEAGARVVAVARSEEALANLQAKYGKRNIITMPTDLLDDKANAALVPSVLSKVGKIDIFHSNAGAYIGGDLVDNDRDAIAKVIKLNFTVPLQNIRDVLPHMIERKSGDIVVTTSLAGHYPTPWEPVYASSKAGIVRALEITRQQVCKHGIRMFDVAPGPVDTPLTVNWPPEMLAAARATKEIMEPRIVAGQVMNALLQPREVTVRNLVMMPTGFKL